MLRNLFLLVPFLLLLHLTSGVALPPCNEDYTGPCYGTSYTENGGKYEGEYKNRMFNGQGKFVHPSGDQYIGQFRDQEPDGWGTYIFSKNSSFFLFGRNAAGLEHHGEFKSGIPNGEATYFWSNGDIWIGHVRNGTQWLSGKKYTAGNVPPEVYADRNEGDLPTSTSDSASMDEAESNCEELGFTPGTEKYGDCILRLMEMN